MTYLPTDYDVGYRRCIFIRNIVLFILAALVFLSCHFYLSADNNLESTAANVVTVNRFPRRGMEGRRRREHPPGPAAAARRQSCVGGGGGGGNITIGGGGVRRRVQA